MNQRTDLSDLCARLQQQQQPPLLLAKQNRRTIHSKIAAVAKETYIKQSNSNHVPPSILPSSNTDKVQGTEKSEKPKQTKVTDLRETVSLMSADETSTMKIVKNGDDLKKGDAKLKPKFVYRRLSAQNDEFTVPFENIERVLKLASKLSTPTATPSSSERNLNEQITTEWNDNIELTTTTTMNGIYETSEPLSRQSIDKITSTPAPIIISSTTYSMENELTTTATGIDVDITSRHINILDTVESTYSLDEDMTTTDESNSSSSSIMTSTTESNFDETTIMTIDFDEITSTQASITQTIDVDDSTLTTETHENRIFFTDKRTDDLMNSMMSVAVAIASDIPSRDYIQMLFMCIICLAIYICIFLPYLYIVFSS